MATETDTPSGSLPVHVAVIMDGNGRWAKRQGMMRVLGHRKGVEAVRRTIEVAREEGIRYLTLYAFSDENWARPRAEVEALMELLVSNLKAELPSFVKNGIRLESIGDVSRLPEGAARELEHCRRETAENKDLVLSLALSYGSQEEIRRCMVRIAQCVARGEFRPQDIDRQTIESNLYTAGMAAGGSDDPYQRGDAPEQFPALAVGLRGVVFHSGAVARFFQRGFPGGATGLCPAGTPFRTYQ